MQIDWTHLKSAIDHALSSARKEERGGLRIHCDAAERMAKKAAKKNGTVKEALEHVHKARNSLEMSRAVELLEQAKQLVDEASPS